MNPNATKHIWEETRGLAFSKPYAEQARLSSLADAIDNVEIGNWENMMRSGWDVPQELRAPTVSPAMS
ncbi:hypothetical protein [Microbispora sp. H10885]|uniref:hypothetical protein n=1 Tax=Microbispora sp. H10885 TaxID=2729110 RepID=UPI0015FF4110|nr:hypothetical protein [Microbispora sp. H10885]